MPTWNHLWFVLYLWVYTLLLAGLSLIPGIARAQPLFDRVFAGWRALLIPVAWVLLIEVVLFQRREDTHDLVNDGVAHLRYVPAFLFGFGLARSAPVMAALARLWPVSATIAVGCWLTIAGLLVAYPDFSFPDSDLVLWSYRVARHLETWTAIAALIGVAERFWNRDGRWRATLAEATFPFYIIHQTIIVVVEGALLPFHLPPRAEFAILVPATVAGCWAFYLLGRELPWLRPLIGLKRVAPARRSATRDRDGLDLDDPRRGGSAHA